MGCSKLPLSQKRGDVVTEGQLFADDFSMRTYFVMSFIDVNGLK